MENTPRTHQRKALNPSKTASSPPPLFRPYSVLHSTISTLPHHTYQPVNPTINSTACQPYTPHPPASRTTRLPPLRTTLTPTNDPSPSAKHPAQTDRPTSPPSCEATNDHHTPSSPQIPITIRSHLHHRHHHLYTVPITQSHHHQHPSITTNIHHHLLPSPLLSPSSLHHPHHLSFTNIKIPPLLVLHLRLTISSPCCQPLPSVLFPKSQKRKRKRQHIQALTKKRASSHELREVIPNTGNQKSLASSCQLTIPRLFSAVNPYHRFPFFSFSFFLFSFLALSCSSSPFGPPSLLYPVISSFIAQTSTATLSTSSFTPNNPPSNLPIFVFDLQSQTKGDQ